jgi:hypothetical protein
MTHQFDELATALAKGVSRREALRKVGGGLVAVVLASLGLPAKAAGPNPCCKDICHGSGAKNASCVKFCSQEVAGGLFCCVVTGTSGGVSCSNDRDQARSYCGGGTITVCP